MRRTGAGARWTSHAIRAAAGGGNGLDSLPAGTGVE